MKHQNTTLEIDADAIDQMAALVLELPGIAIASEMLTLKELHLADYQESKRFEDLAKELEAKISADAKLRSEKLAAYDRAFEKVKAAEDQAYRLLMEHRTVSDYRAEFGGRLGIEVRKAVKEVLGKNDKYLGWVNQLGILNAEMRDIDRNTDKYAGEIDKHETLAAKLMASSEDLFKQIQALRAKLNE